MAASATLGSAMAIAIRYASRQQHPFEIDFPLLFRRAVPFLPLLVRPRTRDPAHAPAQFTRLLRGRHRPMMWWFWRCPPAAGAGGRPVLFDAAVHHDRRRARARRSCMRVRWSAVIAGFIGVLVDVCPTATDFSSATLVALLAAAFISGMVTISIKYPRAPTRRIASPSC
ncbi:MAG: hypothetical protein R3F08_04190 [Dokdonella sp.]